MANSLSASLAKFRLDAQNIRVLVGPILIVMVLGMMVLPLPPFVLDLFFTFNIALAVMILLTAMLSKFPLDFAAFPSVLLFATLLRLSLNVASTRVVLLNGHKGEDAAGKVIEAFGHFLVGSNFAVGLVVFVILVIINFVVITKGAGRIAEVGARFTLDSVPGKQMAVDADLNAGLIGEEQARARRRQITQESEFYGAMDGASKFVRGDAIAGLLIMVINLIGGLVVGVVQHDLSFAQAGRIYTLLTVGDGLVAQLPSLIIATATGVVVSRVASGEDVGQQILGQLFSQFRPLTLTGIIIGILGLIPNMPHTAFLLLALVMLATGRWLRKRTAALAASAASAGAPQALRPENAEATWDDVKLVDLLALEVGYRLIPLVNVAQGGELIQRIRGLRRKFAQEIGFLSPVIHISDNLDLAPNSYRFLLSGVEAGRGEAFPGQWLAINPGGLTEKLPGMSTTDPAYGLPATWIAANQREHAQSAGFTVVDASTVVATHIDQIMHAHAADLLGRQETQQLIERVTAEAPKLMEEFIPKTVTLAVLQKVLQGLLAEGIPIRDMRTIVEAMIESATRLGNGNAQAASADALLAQVRQALGPAIVQQFFGSRKTLSVIGLDPQLDRVLNQALQSSAAIEPGLAQKLVQQTQKALDLHVQTGAPPVLLVSPVLRAGLARFLHQQIPDIVVLSSTEIPGDREVKIATLVGNSSSGV